MRISGDIGKPQGIRVKSSEFNIGKALLEFPAWSPEAHDREGIYCYHRAAYNQALHHFMQAARAWQELGHHDRWLEACIYTLRIHAELERTASINETETLVVQALNTQVLSSSIRGRAYYILGVCKTFRAETIDLAVAYYRTAIQLAVEADDKRSLAYPIYGLANVAWYRGQYDETAAELEKLELILDCISIPELRSGSKILLGLLLRNKGDLDGALAQFWNAYRSLRQEPNFILYIHALHAIGSVYVKKNDFCAARHYLHLAREAINETELPRLKRLIDATLANCLEASPTSTFDYRFDVENGIVYDRTGQAIRLQGRFVLHDLALLLMRVPGRVFSKEEIVQHVWDETYDPVAHDNKIYVTVKRLRQLLEVRLGADASPCIARVKNGYCFDSNCQVLITTHEQKEFA